MTGLKTRGYLEERKGKVRATDKAKAFYALLPPEIRGADVTARWWLIQQDIADGKDINDEGQSVTVTSTPAGSTYGKTGVDMTNIAIAIGILLIAAGCATAYGIKSRKTTKGDADESAEDNTEA